MASAGKKFLTFLLLMIAVCLVAILSAYDTVSGCIRMSLGGPSNTTYYELSATTDGMLWAIGRDNEDYVVCLSTMNGCKWTKKLNDKRLPDYFIADDLYAVSEDCAFLTGHVAGENGEPSKLLLYAISGNGEKLTSLLSIDDTGRSTDAQRSSAGFSAFSKTNESVRFLLNNGEKSTKYEVSISDLSLHTTGVIDMVDWNDALVLHDGMIAFARKSGIISLYSSYGVPQYDLEVIGNAAALFDCGDSFYFLDDSTNMLNEVGRLNDEYYLVQKISVDSGLPITVMSGGIALWLDDGNLIRYDGQNHDISSILYPSAWKSRGSVAAGLLCAILFSALLTAFLCGKRQVSMLVRGFIVICLSLMITSGLRSLMVVPLVQSDVMENVQKTVESVADMGITLAPESNGLETAEDTAARISASLEGNGLMDSKVTIYCYIADGYKVVSTTDPMLEQGATVFGSGLMLSARQDGVISRLRDTLNGKICEAVAAQGSYIVYVQANMARLLAEAKESAKPLTDIMQGSQIILCLIMLTILFKIWGGVKRITTGVNLVSAGEYDIELYHDSGDELEGLAKALNHMTSTIKSSVNKAQTIDRNYMRFIPEDTIKLLGVDRLEDVSRETVSNHEMVTMTVSFQLPREGLSTEELFSELNELIERTVFSSVAFGGNNFNFNFSSYNVVFENDYPNMAFMSAVAIQDAVNSLNKEREYRNKQPIVLRIAMDRGLVRLGVIGDDLHMVPAAVSRSLDKIDTMLEISEKLDAYITFSETLLPDVGENSYRFVGQFATEDQEQKLYELFDGDTYLSAQRKRETLDEFNKAIEAFYQSDFTFAKRILLQLARTGSGCDGPVRYYLNVADRFEQEPPKNLLLNGEK